MEPFDLKLQQITFDEQSLPEGDLDSFNNVIHYDSALIDTTTGKKPSTQEVSDSSHFSYYHRVSNQLSHTVAQPSRVKVTNVYNQSVWSNTPQTGTQVTHFLVNPDSKLVSCTTVTDCDIRTLLQVSKNTSLANRQDHKRRRDSARMAESGAGDASNSVEPFESVAEALHLQQSVIGSKKITPAPPDVVARIVAEAERKLKMGAAPLGALSSPSVPLTTPTEINMTTTNMGAPPASVQMDSNAVPLSMPPVDNQLDFPGLSNATTTRDTRVLSVSTTPGVMTLSSNEYGLAQQLGATSSQNQFNVSDISTVPSTSSHLIRIPPAELDILSSRDKNSRIGSKSHSTSDNVNSYLPVSGNLPQTVTTVSDGSQGEPIVDDTQSVASSCSELDVLSNIDTENFLKSLPAFNPINLSDIVVETKGVKTRELSHSPPVKETSFRPVNGVDKSPIPSQDVSQSSGYQSFVTDSGVFSPEARLTSTTSDNLQQKKSYFVIPKAGPLFQNTPRPAIPTNLQSLLQSPNKAPSNIRPVLTSSQKNAELAEMQHENVKLEGQLEMLTIEAQATLQERAELQAQVASLKLKLMSQKVHEHDTEKDHLKADLDSLRQLRLNLEQSVLDLQRQLEEKCEEARTLQDELIQTQDNSDRLNLKIKQMRDGMREKEVTIQALKNKVAELYVDVQLSLQAKMEADNLARSAKGDLSSLISTKEWYQEQLEIATRARSELQKELTILQAQASSQSSIIERLKSDNTKLRQQLSEIQQKALSEKEVLAKHLETIESDMLDRESAFQEIQRERSFLEDTFNTKIQTVEDERNRISLLMQMTTDLENQLDKAHNELKKKHKQINVLEMENIALMKQLTLAQESVMEKEGTILELKQSLIDVESRLKAFQNAVMGKDTEILSLKEEKAKVEIALKSALHEKDSVDKVLDSLKSDMGKVETSFRLMRQELNTKSEEMNKIRTDSEASDEQIESLKKQIEIERRNYQTTLQDQTQKSEQLNQLHQQKVVLDSEVIVLTEKLTALETAHNEAVKENQLLDSELVATRDKLIEAEEKLKTETEALQTSDVNTEQYNELEKKNAELVEKVSQMEKDRRKDVLKHKARCTKLGQELKSVQDELTKRQAMFDSNVELLSGKLREVVADKEKLETELMMAKRKYELSVIEQQDQISSELQGLATELEQVRLEKQSLESQLTELQCLKDADLQHYQSQLTALETEMGRVIAEREESVATRDRNLALALELEKERGRLAGMMQSNATLKQHVGQLEEALAGRESALVDTQAQMAAALREADQQSHDHIRRVAGLEESLQRGKDEQREIRKQNGLKIAENKKLKRQVDTLKQDSDQLRHDLDHKQHEASLLQSELDTCKQTLLSQQSESKNNEMESKAVSRELERVRQQMADNLAREPVIREQIQSLQWELEIKLAELDAAQQQMTLVEERQLVEMNNIKGTLQEKNKEVESLKQEVESSKRDRQSQQARIAELRSALKSSVSHHKMMEKLGKLRAINGGSDMDPAQLPPLPFDLADMDKLLLDTSVRALDSKPLDNLQTCLSTLRSEISGLQLQMDAHSNTVQTSTNTWSTVEKQVQELVTTVQTINNTATANTSTTSLAAAAIDLANRYTNVI